MRDAHPVLAHRAAFATERRVQGEGYPRQRTSRLERAPDLGASLRIGAGQSQCAPSLLAHVVGNERAPDARPREQGRAASVAPSLTGAARSSPGDRLEAAAVSRRTPPDRDGEPRLASSCGQLGSSKATLPAASGPVRFHHPSSGSRAALHGSQALGVEAAKRGLVRPPQHALDGSPGRSHRDPGRVVGGGCGEGRRVHEEIALVADVAHGLRARPGQLDPPAPGSMHGFDRVPKASRAARGLRRPSGRSRPAACRWAPRPARRFFFMLTSSLQDLAYAGRELEALVPVIGHEQIHQLAGFPSPALVALAVQRLERRTDLRPEEPSR